MSSELVNGRIHEDDGVDSSQILYRALLKKSWMQMNSDGTMSVVDAAFVPKQLGEPISVDIATLTTAADSLKKFKPETGLASFPCQVALNVDCRVVRELDPSQPDNLAHAHVYLPSEAEPLDVATARLADASTILMEYDRKRTTHIVSESQDERN